MHNNKIQFNISGKGSPVSILKNGTKNAEFFPTVGETNYRDISGTTYKIRSSDSKLFRITDMVITKEGASFRELKAEPNESLEALITLNAAYIVSITTERVEPVQPALNPIISLVKDEERRYNMNTKAGVPLLIQRNSDVKAITLIIGDDVMEFDELGDDNIIGITIPETSFKKIGKYEVKLFPFSFEDYENSISIDYLSRLNERYEAWIHNYNKGELLIIDIDNLDFVDHQEDLEKIISMVDEKLKK